MILEVTHISKSYKNGTRNLAVLSDISFSVDLGEIITIMGPSGSGKSTLMNILGTLDKADKGTVRICDKKTDNLDDRSLAELRNKHIGFRRRKWNKYSNVKFFWQCLRVRKK